MQADLTAGSPDLSQPVRVTVVGLGKLGLAVAAGVLARPDLRLVGAVDLDPVKLGRDIGELTGRAPSGLAVCDGADEAALDCDVVVLMTASRIGAVADTIADFFGRGADVLTSAEELAYPWREFPEESRGLDGLARRRGRSLLSAGANPGFVMDLVPLLLSLGSQRLDQLTVTRTMDVSPHRAARLTRFGLGTTEPEFGRLDPRVAHGHIGFRQSIDAIADALEVRLDRVEETSLTPAVITDRPRRGDTVTIEPGQVAVVSQGAAGVLGGERLIVLEEHFGFLDGDPQIPSGDRVSLRGADQQFEMQVDPGLRSFATTPAVLVNLIRPLRDAPPGLLSTLDFTVRELSSRAAGASS